MDGEAWQATVHGVAKNQTQLSDFTHSLTPTATRKRRNEEPQGQQKEGILKIRAEINAKETKETIAKINKAKSWFFEKMNKIDRPLTRLIKKQREKDQINKIRNENGETTTDNTEIRRMITDYYQQLYVNKLDNSEEMNKFLEKYNFPKLNQEEIENLNIPITSTDFETESEIFQQTKAQDQMASQLNSTKNLEKS